MYDHFGLVLVMNHACNMRCTYCYTGEKANRAMPEATAKKAIDRAIASISPGGALELGFFGGEPLIEATRIESLIGYAVGGTASQSRHLTLSMTTNGTIDTPAAWRVMLNPQLNLAISCDGLPEIHDRHRLRIDGGGTSSAVISAIGKLLANGRAVRVVMVVRPDSVARMVEGMEFLWSLGVREFEPSLDVWTKWTEHDQSVLRNAVQEAAKFWRNHLPDISIGWFDEKAVALTRSPLPASARCGFGAGEIAVSPAGNLYPCERLVGADEASNPMRLPGTCMMGDDFLQLRSALGRDDVGCSQCSLLESCNTVCQCSNYIRTGDVRRPDGLLCDWNQTCIDAVAVCFDPPAQQRRSIHLALAR